ncbi:hypothetical protein [Actinoallomurus sp. NPDC050550]|uniref:hypothetical protein n=1 Tax=Actinoallomurus sp. NPDC050550 TaxID=3154937 RepID=UPI0033F03A2E
MDLLFGRMVQDVQPHRTPLELPHPAHPMPVETPDPTLTNPISATDSTSLPPLSQAGRRPEQFWDWLDSTGTDPIFGP